MKEIIFILTIKKRFLNKFFEISFNIEIFKVQYDYELKVKTFWYFYATYANKRYAAYYKSTKVRFST
jgi:hypothetical protein